MKETIVKYLLTVVSLVIPLLFAVILFNVIGESLPALTQIGWGLFDSEVNWRPTSVNPGFSILPIVLSTVYVAFLAVVMATPLACLCAIFLNYYADQRLAKLILAFVDMLAGVPSVIFGFIGLVIVVRNFQTIFNMSAGESILAASVVLAVMLLPYIISSYSESIKIAKNNYDVEALALGTSREYAILNIIIPATKRSAASAITAAFGRAIGETMAVMMVIGGSPIFPVLLGRGQTIAGLTAQEFGGAAHGSMHLSALFAANLVLLVLLSFIFAVTHFLKKGVLKEHDKV